MLTGFDHFLIPTAELAATRDWYVDVLGLAEGPACQVFMHDPNGSKVAPNFPAAEAKGLQALVTAQGARQ